MSDRAANSEAVSLDHEELSMWISLIRVCHLLPDRLDAALRAQGSTLPRYEILAVLSQSQDGVRVTELGRSALVSKPRVSLHLAELIEAGWVSRRADPTDGRASIVSITDAGRERLDELSPGHVALARQLVIDQMSTDGDRSTVAAALDRVRCALGDDWNPLPV